MARDSKAMTPEMLESFVNDYLKEDLKQLENNLTVRNAEIMEFIQLKNMIETIKEHLHEGFKTQTNIGGNIFMQAKIKDTNNILVNIGKDIYVQFTADEAIAFAKFKINVINKEIDVIREESIKKKADIKLACICIGENRKLNLNKNIF